MKMIVHMKKRTKVLRTAAWIYVIIILLFTMHAILQFHSEDENTAQQINLFFHEGWVMTTLKRTQLPETENYSHILGSAREQLAAGKFQEAELPYTGKSSPEDMILFHNTLPEEYAGMLLQFSSADITVRVILDGEIIYQHEPFIDGASETYGHFAEIPYMFQNGELWIAMVSSAPDTPIILSDISINADNSSITVIGNNIADIGSCLLIIIMAIIMFVLALVRRYTNQPACGEIYLGLTGLAAGIYYFIYTDSIYTFSKIPQAYIMQDYLVLLIPIFLTLYYEQNLHARYPRRFSILLWCVCILGAVQILLQMQGTWGYEKTELLSAAAVVIVCMTAAASLIQIDFKARQHQSLLSILSIFVLLSRIIANMIAAAFYNFSSIHFGVQHNMAVYSIMTAVIHIMQLLKEYRASTEEHARLLNEKIKTAEQQNIQLALAKKDADAARHEALAANEAKGKFLAHMSHEIRTPINAVLGMDEMILRESKETHIKEYAMDIYTAGQTLLSLINDILDFSKIESGKMEIIPVEYDISSLIHDLANMASQRAEAKNIQLIVEADHNIPSRLYGDDVRIRQVLTNILTNAVKYTHEGTVWLRIQSRSRNDTAELTFEVEDTGMGIKEEDLPKLSAEFERIEEDKNRNIEGTGLGMNITIQLLELLGSRLQVESVYGKGSKFYFQLNQKIVDHSPIGNFKSRVYQMAENYNYNTKFQAPDAQILVVDDNGVNRKVLRNLLKETRIQITDAPGGAECLELIQKNHYDLIFLDHMMPDMDGLETLRRIKRLSDFPCQSTPIIVLTANAVSGAKEHYLAEGFDDFLSKPVVPEKLESMIKKMLPEHLLLEPDSPLAENSSIQTENNSTDDIPETLPQVDGLDWQYAWLHLPDLELLEYTTKEFYAQIDSAANRLEQAFAQITEPGQLEQYRIQVHAMKSLGATVGITPLSGIAKVLEYAARDGRTDVVLSLTPVFLEEWRSYRDKLQGVFGIGLTEKQTAADYSVIQALVEMVRLNMQEMDIEQADQYMNQLQTYEYPAEINQNMQKLAEAVTNLDPEETDRLAKLLIKDMAKEK